MLGIESTSPSLLRVAVLVDLPRSAQSGGHVKCWERIAKAAADSTLPLDLTVYFSGPAAEERLAKNVRLRQIEPVFSSANLKFLPYMPDTTDLSPWHGRLAKELTGYDLIHTTDGFFAFARTAARVSAKTGIPLVTSFHTDTPAYARVFTKQAIESFTRRWPIVRKFLINELKLPEWQGRNMDKKLADHIHACRYALVTRPEDRGLAESIMYASKVKPLRLGVDKKMFDPYKADRAGLCAEYKIDEGSTIILFVGRVDSAKNIYTLVEAAEKLIGQGVKLHVIVAGQGPAADDVQRRLGKRASLLGYVEPEALARLYASVDALAITSEIEIRGMVGDEALASGCPVLVSEKSGIAPLFNNTSAMQVVPGGAANWAKALGDFAADITKRQNMRSAALNFSEKFLTSWQDVLREDLFPVWQAAAGEKRRKAA